MATQITHDAFGRYSTVREKAVSHECDNCGRKGRTWHYGVNHDDRNRDEIDRTKAYCSIGCFRAYWGA